LAVAGQRPALPFSSDHPVSRRNRAIADTPGTRGSNSPATSMKPRITAISRGLAHRCRVGGLPVLVAQQLLSVLAEALHVARGPGRCPAPHYRARH
ncbi:hypothetical protein OH541_18075, partial [Pseudomonas cichorii]|nr:hypothetical protein [Pseudomonas cichorii]